MWRDWVPLPPLRRGLLTSPFREMLAQSAIERGWVERADSLRGSHGRTPGVVISLTSHAARFTTLAPTLRSLLLQTLRPQAVVLWIAHRDMAALPAEVLHLCDYGLTIEPCEDHGPHTKYVHAMRRYPHTAIAICDDDTYYAPEWLAGLVEAEQRGIMPCYRMHRVTIGDDGMPLGYRFWDHDSSLRDVSPLNFPTGVGGVLLRAENFDAALLDTALARRLCPSTDDIWLYVTARVAGSRFRLIGNHVPLIAWTGSQFSALWKQNVLERGNDLNMRATIAHFGGKHILAEDHKVLAA